MLIVQLTDLHLRPEGQPAYRVAETNMLAARAVETVAAMDPAPDLVVLTGDLTDCGLAPEYAELARLLRGLPCPVACVLGNHDRREAFRAAFPALAGPGPFVDFVHDIGPVRAIGLDTVVPGFGHGALCEARLDALAARLAERPEAPTLLFLHHPPFDCGIRHMDRIALIEGRDRLAGIVAANPQVVRVCAGHHHRPIQALYSGAIAQVAPSVAHQVRFDLREGGPAAFVMEPPAFLAHVLVGGLVVTHQVYVERYPGPFPFVLDDDYPARHAPEPEA